MPNPEQDNCTCVKDLFRDAIDRMPEGIEFDGAIDWLITALKVERGIARMDAGQGIPHEQAKKKLGQWLD